MKAALGPRAAPRPPLPAGPFLVVGLARSGIAVAKALAERGERVVGCDARLVPSDVAAELEAADVEVHGETDGVALLAGAATVIKSPGVPREVRVVAEALARGLAVCGELELAWRLLPNRFLAVTGSNGKTTTVELLGHMFRTGGLPVEVAGNVGTALSGLIGTVPEETTIVCEASSFQLEDTLAFAPEAALILNVTPDHLDRHGTFVAYRDAKLRIFALQQAGSIAVLPGDDPALLDAVDAMGGSAGGAARRVLFGLGSVDGLDLTVSHGALRWRGVHVIDQSEIRLRGAHNLQNAMGAAAAALAWGVDAEHVANALRTFAGVPHRLEEVATIGGVLYVNDSKATNIDASATGIRSFATGVHVILGGQGKGGDYRPIADALATQADRAQSPRGVAAYLIGECPQELRDAAASVVPVHEAGDLETALRMARADAAPGEVVLLSPACASFDQYTSFEHRGDHFRELVRAMQTQH